VRENPAIAEHGIVAYAGEALETASGHVLGTLCVVSKERREWTDAELDLCGNRPPASETGACPRLPPGSVQAGRGARICSQKVWASHAS
jgi:hypothetical protein